MKKLTQCILSGIAPLLVGCYSLEPIGGVAPQPGVPVALDINDRGRVELGGQMGPEISQIEGRLLSRDTAEYLVAVTTVRLLRGGEQVWKGEQVRVRSSYVSTVYERRFSKTRTAVAAAAGLGAVAVMFSQGLFGGGPTTLDPMLPDTSNAVRIPRP